MGSYSGQTTRFHTARFVCLCSTGLKIGDRLQSFETFEPFRTRQHLFRFEDNGFERARFDRAKSKVRTYVQSTVALLLIQRILANLLVRLHNYLYYKIGNKMPISPVHIGRPRRAKAGGKCGRKFPNPFSGAEWVEIAYVELEKKHTPNHPPLHT